MIFKLFFRTESFTSFTSGQGYNNYTIINTIKNTNYNCLLFFYTPNTTRRQRQHLLLPVVGPHPRVPTAQYS